MQPGITCPYCHYQGQPIVKKQMSVGGWVLFGVLLLACIPLCWLPFIIDGCQETVTHCPSCKIKLG